MTFNTGVLKVDGIQELTGQAGVDFGSATDIKVDDINESTSTHGVVIDGMQIKDSEPYTDKINEKTANNVAFAAYCSFYHFMGILWNNPQPPLYLFIL